MMSHTTGWANDRGLKKSKYCTCEFPYRKVRGIRVCYDQSTRLSFLLSKHMHRDSGSHLSSVLSCTKKHCSEDCHFKGFPSSVVWVSLPPFWEGSFKQAPCREVCPLPQCCSHSFPNDFEMQNAQKAVEVKTHFPLPGQHFPP